MLRLLSKIPQQKIFVACSGGVDSIAVLNFLSNNHDVGIAFFDHGTETSSNARQFLLRDSFDRYERVFGEVKNPEKPDDLSWEEYWRNERYAFLESIEHPVITAHHLDDALETYIWRMCHGRSDTIPYRRKNIIRPFLLNKKSELVEWAVRKNLRWIEDTTNHDLRYTRNNIRQNVLPNLLTVAPGLYKIVKDKIIERKDYVTQ
jgi:tRNA(Ile)-lysidine synthetase-like protein